MNMRGIRETGPGFGALSALSSFVGAAALLGYIFLGSGPEALSTGARLPAATATVAASPSGSPYVSSDPSVPSASSVFEGRADEPAPPIDTF